MNYTNHQNNHNQGPKQPFPPKNKKEEKKDRLDGCGDGCCSFDGCMVLIALPAQAIVAGYLLIDKLF
ncbi:hypothetical protein [Metabacillus sp. 84]|uniref:hypothetical protein n=1 Tax=unclassified Metabacillus TaxID=2675274 RepID=UPI003CF1E380